MVIKLAKKYKLHCFRCGNQFNSKKEVHRHEGKPFCDEYIANIWIGQAEAEQEDNYIRQWRRDHPNVDYDEWIRDQVYIAKYGEC